MGCSFGWGHGHGQGGGGWCALVCCGGWFRSRGLASPGFCEFCFVADGRQCRLAQGRFLPSNSNEAVYCLCVCVRSCSSSSKTHTHKTPCTHPLSRQDLLVGLFFVSHAIPLLASEASLFIIPI